MAEYELCVGPNASILTMHPDLRDDHDLVEGSFVVVEVTAVDHSVAESLEDLRGD